jgi:predicted Zn finger-like uncharacterized protein
MTIIKCPNCNSALQINIAKALDEHGEVFRCPKCNYLIRYASDR